MVSYFVCYLTEEFNLAMEEIQDKQKDMKQLVDVSSIFFERNNDLQLKVDEQSNQIQEFMMEIQKTQDELLQLRVSISTSPICAKCLKPAFNVFRRNHTPSHNACSLWNKST